MNAVCLLAKWPQGLSNIHDLWFGHWILLAIGHWKVCLNHEHANLEWTGLLLKLQLGLNVQMA